jgi:hypothetical protein
LFPQHRFPLPFGFSPVVVPVLQHLVVLYYALPDNVACRVLVTKDALDAQATLTETLPYLRLLQRACAAEDAAAHGPGAGGPGRLGQQGSLCFFRPWLPQLLSLELDFLLLLAGWHCYLPRPRPFTLPH